MKIVIYLSSSVHGVLHPLERLISKRDRFSFDPVKGILTVTRCLDVPGAGWWKSPIDVVVLHLIGVIGYEILEGCAPENLHHPDHFPIAWDFPCDTTEPT